MSQSGIENSSFKIDLDYFLSTNHTIKSGINYTFHQFSPETSQKTQQHNDSSFVKLTNQHGKNNIFANELNFYLEDEWNIFAKLKMNFGFRVPIFLQKNESYFPFEPRISLNYLINQNLAANFTYAKMTQFIHLLSNSSLGLPTDLWLPAIDKIKPSTSNQFSLGTEIFLPFCEINIESFYKTMNKRILFF